MSQKKRSISLVIDNVTIFCVEIFLIKKEKPRKKFLTVYLKTKKSVQIKVSLLSVYLKK